MYLPTLDKAITTALAISTTITARPSPRSTPSISNLTATLLQGPSQNCITDPKPYSMECDGWAKAIVNNNLTKEVEALRETGVFTFLPGVPQLNKTDTNMLEVRRARTQWDSLYNKNWRDDLAADELPCQCCDMAKSASCCAFRALSEDNAKCCRREGPRCGYPVDEGGRHTFFCVCNGQMNCIKKGMWPAWVNPACGCDTTCNLG